MIKHASNCAAVSSDEAPEYAEFIRLCWRKSKNYFGEVGINKVPVDSGLDALYDAQVRASLNRPAKDRERCTDLDGFFDDVATQFCIVLGGLNCRANPGFPYVGKQVSDSVWREHDNSLGRSRNTQDRLPIRIFAYAGCCRYRFRNDPVSLHTTDPLDIIGQ